MKASLTEKYIAGWIVIATILAIAWKFGLVRIGG